MERAKRFLQGRRGRLFMAAGGMALIVSAVYAACGFWPFGPNSVMTGDLNSQYIPFYAHFYDAAREGGSLFYAGDLGLGGGAFALFAYYFASPFAWLYLIVAPEFYGQLCCIVYAAKVILAAAAFCFYLERRWGDEKALWLPLCWCYGLMGYAVAYAQNVLWLDAVLLLPLVCAGIDRLLAGKGAVGFCLALAAAIFTNFYMGYMLCIFSALYFIAGLAVQTPRPGGKAVLSAFGRFAAAGVTAAALAGVVLLPAVTIGFNNAVLSEASMSYLGIGITPPQASLGSMLSDAQSYLRNAPWYALSAGCAVALLILSFSLLGEGLQQRSGRS